MEQAFCADKRRDIVSLRPQVQVSALFNSPALDLEIVSTNVSHCYRLQKRARPVMMLHLIGRLQSC